MISRIGGTVVDGELELDEPVPLPPSTRVTGSIESVSDQAQRQAAWERFQRRVREYPLDLGGRDWTSVRSGERQKKTCP
ncbi:MAG: hypothetical protein NTY19_48670 [Planctomycetota bacterium]|nr:hypothetical protein [Planctomycetota bacterium]